MLFQVDLTGTAPGGIFEEFWAGLQAGEEVRAFAERLVAGTHDHLDSLDRAIASSAEHWRVDRMAAVDRNVLRMAAYEMLSDPDTPPVVVIDEAIEIAKKFGTEDSGGFINGILDSIRIRMERGELGLHASGTEGPEER
jgi:N utilization substance protein B